MISRMKGVLALVLIVTCMGIAPAVWAKSNVAVIVVKSPTLSESEQVSMANIISKGFADTGRYKIVDPATLDKMLEDEVASALLMGNESKLDEIQKKYQVDVLVNVSAQVENSNSVGAYVMASSSVTIACRRKNTEELFDHKASEPQNGFYGMPEWLGNTAEAARRVAIQAAVADVFKQIEFDTVPMPLPFKPSVTLVPENDLPAGVEFMPRYDMSSTETSQLVKLAADTIGSRNKITSNVLDRGKRIAAVGLLNIDIDLQRGRRIDTAEFQVFDFLKKRQVTSFKLPQEIDGIRRPSSREIVDFAFAPSGRFLVVASKHPVIWVYDVLTGTMMANLVLADTPDSVSLSVDGRHVQVNSGKKKLYFRVDSNDKK